MERLDARAKGKIAGPSWEPLRPQFEAVSEALLAVSPEAQGELTTIYVKFHAKESGSQPFAVIWLRSSAELVIGLSLPPDYKSHELGPAPPRCKYAGLTAYLRLRPNETVPRSFAKWAQDAYQFACSSVQPEQPSGE
jgi:hypothetical protein